MTRLATCAALFALIAAGCELLQKGRFAKPKAVPPTFSRYHMEGWEWVRVNRVYVLPFSNETEYTHAGEEAQAAFASEFQKLGRYEVTSAPYNYPAALAATIHRGGRFDELAMLEIARLTRADVVVHGIVTFYSPYPRPRIGLVIQAVSPRDGKVIASVDGVWDTTDQAVADRCRLYYRGGRRERLPFIRNHVIVNDDSFAGELALDSPALFRRWVFFEAIQTLVGLPVPGVILPDLNYSAVATAGAQAGCAPLPAATQPPAPGANVK